MKRATVSHRVSLAPFPGLMFARLVVASSAVSLAVGCSQSRNDENDTSAASQAIVAGNNPPSNDLLAPSVVRLTSSDGSEYCTGTLISPKLVLTASHCFVSKAENNGNFQAKGGKTCTATDGHGYAVTSTCGYANFYATGDSSNHPSDSIPIRRVTLNTTQMPDDPAHDLAIAELEWRATPTSTAHAQPTRPWVDGDQSSAYWAAAPIAYYGWGHQDPDATGSDDCGGRDHIVTLNLRYWTQKMLDSNAPITQTEIDHTTPNLNGYMFQARWTSDESNGLPLHGDSGGPLFIRSTDGTMRLAGVASTTACYTVVDTGTQFLWARTMEGTNPAFINRVAIRADGRFYGDDVPVTNCATSTEDPDCDSVPAAGVDPSQGADNCPLDFNPDQRDSDGDGQGDACDSCPNIFDDGANINLEGEQVYYERTHGGTDLPHLQPGATDQDVFNHDHDLNAYFPNDVCDAHLTTGPTANQYSNMVETAEAPFGTAAPGRPMGCNPNSPPRCSTSTSLLEYSPFAYNPAPGIPVAESWRRCVCAEGDGNLCDLACPRIPALFDDATSTQWIPLRNGAGSLKTPALFAEYPIGNAPSDEDSKLSPTLPASRQTNWRWWTDPALASSTIPPPPTATLSENLDVLGLKGRLWSAVSKYNGMNTSTYGDDALHEAVYSPFEIDEFGPPLPHIPIPLTGPRANFVNCPECPQYGSLIFFNKGDPADTRVQIVMSPSQDRIDITRRFSQPALVALNTAGTRLITASEPSYALTNADLSAVMLAPSGNIPATFTTDNETGRVDVGIVGSDPPSLDAPPANAAVALGGRRHAVFAVASIQDGDDFHRRHPDCRRHHKDDDGNDEEAMWISLAISPSWNLVTIPNPEHGKVLGVTVAGSATSDVYVLDQTTEHHRNFLRVYRVTENGDVQEVVRWEAGQTTKTFLSTTYDGGLLVARSDYASHEFLHFSLG